MATPRKSVSFSEIQTEFGGTNPISLSEYQGDGNSDGVGSISTSDLLNTSNSESVTNEAISGRWNDPNAWMSIPTDFQFSGDIAVGMQYNFDSITIHDVSNPEVAGIIGFFFDDTNMNSPLHCTIVDDYVYITNEGADLFTVFDISTPHTPVFVTTLAISCNRIIRDGDYLYMTGQDAAVRVMDISTRNAPVLAATFTHPTIEDPEDIIKVGDYLYVTDIDLDNIVTIDVSIPTSPAFVTDYNFQDTSLEVPWRILHKDGYIYVGSIDGMFVLDATAPSNLSFISQHQSPNMPFTGFSEDIEDMKIVDNNLWILQEAGSFIERYDISDPLNVTYQNSLYEPLASDAWSLTVKDNHLYATSLDHDGVVVVSVEDPDRPKRVAYVGPDYIAAGFALLREDDLLYVSNYWDGSGVFIYDVSEGPEKRKLIGQYQNSLLMRGIRTMKKFGDYVYCGCNFSDRVVVLNVSDPTNPTVASWISGDTFDLYIESTGNWMYGTSPNDEQLTVYDISNPNNIQSPSAIGLGGDNPSHIIEDEANDYLYITGGDQITPIDISIRSSPNRGTPGTNAALVNSRDAVRVGTWLYVSDFDNDSVTVWDISIPGTVSYQANVVDATNLNGASGLTASNDGNTLIVGMFGSDRVTTIDITTKVAPIVLGSVEDGSLLDGCEFCLADPNDDTIVWVQAQDLGSVVAIDISTLASPSIRAAIVERPADGLEALTVNGRYLYAYAYFTRTLCVFDISGTLGTHLVGWVSSLQNDQFDMGIAYNNGRVYLPGGNTNTLTAFDVRNPRAPLVEGQLVDNVNLQGGIDVTTEGDICWVTAPVAGVVAALNISNPKNIQFVSSVAVPSAEWITKDGDYLYVVSSDVDTFHVIDATNPISLSVVGSLTDGVNLNYPYRPSIDGDYAYVGSFNSDNLSVIDISTKATPTVAGSVSDAVNLLSAGHCTFSGDTVYVCARGADAVALVDVSVKTAPVYVSSIPNGELDGVQQILIHGNRIYASGPFDDAVVTID